MANVFIWQTGKTIYLVLSPIVPIVKGSFSGILDQKDWEILRVEKQATVEFTGREDINILYIKKLNITYLGKLDLREERKPRRHQHIKGICFAIPATLFNDRNYIRFLSFNQKLGEKEKGKCSHSS